MVEQWAIYVGFVTLIALINVLGLKWVSRLSIFFLVFILTPFIAMIGTNILHVTANNNSVVVCIRHLVKIEDISVLPNFATVDWGLFLSTVIWCYGGFDSMGAFAGASFSQDIFILIDFTNLFFFL